MMIKVWLGILRNRGELQPEVTGEISNRSKRRIRKNKIA